MFYKMTWPKSTVYSPRHSHQGSLLLDNIIAGNLCVPTSTLGLKAAREVSTGI